MARATCLNGDCGKHRHACGLCQDCYNQHARAGLPMPLPPFNSKTVRPPPTRAAAAERYARFLALNEDESRTVEQIAFDLRVSPRTVERYRQGLRHQQEQTNAMPPIDTPPAHVAKPAPRAERGPDLVTTRGRARFTEHLLTIATHLACMVRDESGDSVAAYLDTLTSTERAHLPIIMAALIPVDRTVNDLLSWITWDEHGNPLPGKQSMAKKATAGARLKKKRVRTRPQKRLKPCGTYAAARRHQKNHEPLCDPCADAFSQYRRDYNASRKAAA
ncbi:DUF7368 family protein [Streptosporangium roseum]|uniref:DUF7368 family protein n=1 Tax=Streptosporangium roseum TaxID=2001 RepID=UPI00332D9FD9